MKKGIVFGMSILTLFGLASCNTPKENEPGPKDNIAGEPSDNDPTNGGQTGEGGGTQANVEKLVVEENDYNKVATNVYMVGDSTMCNYNPLDKYYYPRYGYGTQMQNYLSKKASVVNLALSGRSSLSFTTESNYSTLKNDINQKEH